MTTSAGAETDYYEFLGISANASESEIRRAYRKASLLYHPDKVGKAPDTLEKFELLQLALSILTDADEKQKYDQTREAKLRRKAENDALESRRRKLKEDLEAGEKGAAAGFASANGAKRTWSERDLNIQRISEENKRKREAATLRKAQEVQERATAEEKSTDSMDRSVKIKWIKEGDGLDIDVEGIEQSFPSGEVETVLVLKDKKRRLEGREKKLLTGTAVVVFTSKAAARKAVLKGPWTGVESIVWANEKEVEPS